MQTTFKYVFPAIRGIQAGREYYVSMCPLSIIPKIFLFDEAEVPPELRAQRVLNKGRVPSLTQYILENQKNYIFSAITASVDGDIEFERHAEGGVQNYLGLLHIPMDARFVINDGQHRRAAIEEALKKAPELGDETIAVVFFVDTGLRRAQQMFADLNRYAIRPNRSLSVLYDHREDVGQRVKSMIAASPLFSEVVDLERGVLSPRSKKLFTLSSIESATRELVRGIDSVDPLDVANFIVSFWTEVSDQIKDWQEVFSHERTSGEIRARYVHSHSVTLQAIGRVGNCCFRQYPEEWRQIISGLSEIDWSRDNPRWIGRPVVNGGIKNSRKIVLLVSSLIKSCLGLPLSDDEISAEKSI